MKEIVNNIFNEDCLKTISKIPNEFIDLVVTSPPYDNLRDYDGNQEFNFKKIAKELFKILKPGGVIVWVVGDQTKNHNESGTSFRQALYFQEIGFNLFDTMIYLKPPRGAVGNNKTYWQSFEYMFVFSKGKPKTINLIKDRENKEERDGDNGTKRLKNGKLKKVSRGGYSQFGRRTNVWKYNIGKGHSTNDEIAHQHPAIFPDNLARDHIKTWSNEGDIVYDPFLGSGTTIKAAEILNRKWIGSEINKKYYNISNERLKNYIKDQ